MLRAPFLIVGIVCAMVLGVVVAAGLKVLPFQAELAEGDLMAVDVVRVVDGDTIIVARDGEEERVRILGVDTPEVARSGQAGERCADEATAFTEELLSGAEVSIIADPSQAETDRYGRTLAYVEADGVDVSAELLAAGLAEVYESAPDIDRYAEYQAAAGRAESPECRDGADGGAVKIQPSTRTRPTAGERKGVLIRLDPDEHKMLRRKALEDDTTIQDVVEGMIRQYINS